MAKNRDKVWAAYCDHEDAAGLASPTIGELVAATGLSPSTIRRATRELVGLGYLELVHTDHYAGPNYYAVIHTPPAEIVDEPPAPLTLAAAFGELVTELTPPTKTVDTPCQNGPESLIEQDSTGESDPNVNRLAPRLVGNVRSGQLPVEKNAENVTPPTKLPATHEGARYPDDYLRCDCGYPKLVAETACHYCGRRYPYVSERPEWHPAQGPRDEHGERPATVTAAVAEARAELKRASQTNRFRRWDKK